LIVESLNNLPKREDFFNKQQAFIDAKRINGELRLRRAQVGDRFRPYGMKQGSKLLSDFLTNRKVNLLDKQSQLVVIDSATDQIVWVVGQEIDDRYRVDSNTTEVVRLAVCSER
jgi:tRNA(Ile)-lysidine synthase